MRAQFQIGTAALSALVVGLLAVAAAGSVELFPEWFVFEHPGFLRQLALVVTALVYGVARAMGNHPAMRPRYAEWLLSTPWTGDRPLPMGPIHLTLGDAVVVIILLLAATGLDPWVPVYIIAAGAGGYFIGLALMLFQTGGTPYALALAAGLALSLRLSLLRPELVPLLAAAMYPVAWLGIRATLRRFPWPGEGPFGRPLPPTLARLRSPFVFSQPERQLLLLRSDAGWPHSALAPRAEVRLVPCVNRVLLALTAGVVVACVIGSVPASRGSTTPLSLVAWLIVVVAAGYRLALYIGAAKPPISLGGRLATRQLVIPRYDVVLLAPAAALVVMAAVPIVAKAIGVPRDIATGVAVAAALLVLNLAGPDLRRWRLTGHHRVVCAIPVGQRAAAG